MRLSVAPRIDLKVYPPGMLPARGQHHLRVVHLRKPDSGQSQSLDDREHNGDAMEYSSSDLATYSAIGATSRPLRGGHINPPTAKRPATPTKPRTYRTTKGGRKRLFSLAEASEFEVLGTGVQLLETTTDEHPRPWHHPADGPPLRISESARSAASGRQLPVGAVPSESGLQGLGHRFWTTCTLACHQPLRARSHAIGERPEHSDSQSISTVQLTAVNRYVDTDGRLRHCRYSARVGVE